MKQSRARLSCLVAWMTALTALTIRADILINEIMYQPASGDPQEQFIELYNHAAVPVDLNGWRLSGAVEYPLRQTQIPANGFLVIVANGSRFTARHPGITNWIGNWTGLLDSRGTLRLRDANDLPQASVHYDSEGDWSMRRLSLDRGYKSWEWLAPDRGGGSSLELVNPLRPADVGQNWDASTATNGTPGMPNSLARLDTAPWILDVTHRPLIPHPEDPVTVVARLVDEPGSARPTATLFWRIDANPPGSFLPIVMADDGLHGDGAANDGSYGAIIPAQPLETIVEYYITASDIQGNLRTYPRSRPEGLRTANLVYQVDDTAYATHPPVYRVVMTTAERQALDDANTLAPLSDANSSGSFVVQDSSGVTVRQQVSFRNRGHGSRTRYPHNLKVALPGDQPWKGRAGVNLNTAYPYVQTAGSAIMREIGLIMSESRLVTVLINGVNRARDLQYGYYAANWETDSDLIQSQMPLNTGGNIYRGIRNRDFGPGTANFVWQGDDYRSYTVAYFKANHLVENDWSDLLNLIAVLNSTNGYAASNYVADVTQHVDVRRWMRYFASQTILDNRETNLSTGYGDDYALYSGGPSDRRFQILPYDLDTILAQGDSGGAVNDDLFRMAIPGVGNTVAAVDRLIKTPEFVRIYYEELLELCRGPFASDAMSARLERLFRDTTVPGKTVASMTNFNAARVAYILSAIPTQLSSTPNLPVRGGYIYGPTSTVRLTGRADAVRTQRVLVAGVPAVWSAWQAQWTASGVSLKPGINRILITALGEGDVELEHLVQEILYDDGTVDTAPKFIANDTVWTAAQGPYVINNDLTIQAGATLSIEPGTSVYFGKNANLLVANGGRLLAVGTSDLPIYMGRSPGGTNWGGIIIHGGPSSPESRLHHLHLEGNNATCIEVADGNLWLDHATFGTTTRPYLSLDRASFRITDCTFPTATAPFELVHGTGGIKAGGLGIFQRNLFGTTLGYNDVVDFTGGNRELSPPIVQFYHNVFLGGSDDLLDLDGTDAWIEGNIFLHCHANGSPDSASAVSGGNDGNRTSEITIINNLFFDCDQAATAKEGNFFTLLNNTIVRMTPEGGLDSDAAVINVRDIPITGLPTAFGRGFYLAGNLITKATQLVRHDDPDQTSVTFDSNLLPLPWQGSGTGNLVAADARLEHVPSAPETQFRTWSEAQIFWDWFELQPDSPARMAGADGFDFGATRPGGVRLSGVPVSATRATTATIHVGPHVGIPEGIPRSGWPLGSGYIAYRWRLDGGDWHEETSIQKPIVLSQLAPGNHQLEVTGQRDSGLYQNDPLLGADAAATLSPIWTVDPNAAPVSSLQRLQLNEILAYNQSIAWGIGFFPDLIELYNPTDLEMDLAGVGIGTSLSNPFRFRFAAGARIAPRGFLVLIAERDVPVGVSGIPLGFSLSRSGDSLLLHSPQTNLIDQVHFGAQIADRSIGRVSSGTWTLNQPTFGQTNHSVPLGSPFALRINEWLTAHQQLASEDYIELFNTDPHPVNAGGCFLANAAASPGQNPIPPLTFIEGHGWIALVADGDASRPNHVNFTLTPDAGFIGLSAPDLTPIDRLIYGPQFEDSAEGRSPDGSSQIFFLTSLSPGAGNGTATTNDSVRPILLNELLADNRSTLESDGSAPDWLELYNPNPDAVDLGGWSLTDDLPAGRKFTFPAGALLLGHHPMRILCNGSKAASATNTGFSLSRSGGFLYLINTAANGGTVADSVAYGLQVRDLSLARYPDGALQWFPSHPTPGSTNVPIALGSASAVKINEWLSDNSAGDDWLELYNPGADPVVLDDFHLSDGPSQPFLYTFPKNSFLGTGSGAWVQLKASGTLHPPDASQLNFRLNRNADQIIFSDPTGIQLDAVILQNQPTDISDGRVPDGSGPVVRFVTLPSPGAHNTLDADQDGMADDWELMHQLNPAEAADAKRDEDGDGLSNREEFLAGTDPQDPSSHLRLAATWTSVDALKLRFTVPAEHRYVLQFSEAIGGNWQTLFDSGNLAIQRSLDVLDASASSGSQRFYRLTVRP